MARQARERFESGVYHIETRGINRQNIFCDQDDYQHFLRTLDRVKTDKFEVLIVNRFAPLLKEHR
jgi:REP element-mobilizing transposase RayT